MEESDGIDEAFTETLRVALAAAAGLGEQLARIRAQQLGEIQHAEEQRARDLTDRLAAWRAAARAQLAPVAREDWWEKATPEMIQQVHKTATAWKDQDPVAADHAVRIHEQVQRRYGIHTNDPGAGEPAALLSVAAANREGHARATSPEQEWDSSKRRQTLAASLANHPDQEAVRARLIADKHQATPPQAAAQAQPGRAKNVSQPALARGRSLGRGGLER